METPADVVIFALLFEENQWEFTVVPMKDYLSWFNFDTYSQTARYDWEGDRARLQNEYGSPVGAAELAEVIKIWIEEKRANCERDFPALT